MASLVFQKPFYHSPLRSSMLTVHSPADEHPLLSMFLVKYYSKLMALPSGSSSSTDLRVEVLSCSSHHALLAHLKPVLPEALEAPACKGVVPEVPSSRGDNAFFLPCQDVCKQGYEGDPLQSGLKLPPQASFDDCRPLRGPALLQVRPHSLEEGLLQALPPEVPGQSVVFTPVKQRPSVEDPPLGEESG